MAFEGSSNAWGNWDADFEFLDYPEFTSTDSDYLDQSDLFSESPAPFWSIDEKLHSVNDPSQTIQIFSPSSCLPPSAFSETSASTPSTTASPPGRPFPLTDTATYPPSDDLSVLPSTAAASGVPPATAPAVPSEPRKRRGRRTKILTPEAKALKREAFLQRNREAASRCRERKKSSTDQLKDRMTELQRSRARLLEERDALMSEVQASKAFLLSCEGCALQEEGATGGGDS